MDFDTEVRVARYGQHDFARLVERIRRRKPDGMHGAVRCARRLPGRRRRRRKGGKILVLYTDGGDTSSSMTYAEILNLLRASDVTLYAVGFLENLSASAQMDQRMRLQQMAELTGGQAFFPTVDQGARRRPTRRCWRRSAPSTRLGYLSTNTQHGRRVAQGRDQGRQRRRG